MHIDLLEEITALVDGEISDAKRVIELSDIINSDNNLGFERFIQSKIKSVCSQRLTKEKTPISIVESIKSKIFLL